MPLHERVGEIFLADESNEAQAAFSESLGRFLVPDIGTDRRGLRVVLLVESPHTHEVCHGYPLAGPDGNHAGRRVTDKLIEFGLDLQNPEQPIGQIVNQEDDGAVQTLGIMNVSELPFQRTAYDCTPWVENDCRNHAEWDNYIDRMRIIKKGPWAGRRQPPNCRELDNAIAEDLAERLRRLHEHNPDVLLVRCGSVAQAFYGKAGIDMQDTCNLPHPSKPSWLGLNPGEPGEQSQEEQDLQCIVDLLQPPDPDAAQEE